MTLDLAILSVTGEPEFTVPISLAEHARLVDVPASQFPLLMRLKDFYEDAQFEPDELAALGEELIALGPLVRSDEPLRELGERLTGLVRCAVRGQLALVAIAD